MCVEPLIVRHREQGFLAWLLLKIQSSEEEAASTLADGRRGTEMKAGEGCSCSRTGSGQCRQTSLAACRRDLATEQPCWRAACPQRGSALPAAGHGQGCRLLKQFLCPSIALPRSFFNKELAQNHHQPVNRATQWTGCSSTSCSSRGAVLLWQRKGYRLGSLLVKMPLWDQGELRQMQAGQAPPSSAFCTHCHYRIPLRAIFSSCVSSFLCKT